MNHTFISSFTSHEFIPSKWNELSCAKCAKNAASHEQSIEVCKICHRIEKDHSDIAECESCGSIGPCDIVNSMLLCMKCTDIERAASIQPVPIPETQNPTEKLVNQINQLANSNSLKNLTDEAIRNGINSYQDFFNASTISIIELEQRIAIDETIEEKRYALAAILGDRIKHLAGVLLGKKKEMIEIAGEVNSIQQYIAKVIPTLRKDIREAYARENPDFKPQIVKEVKSRVRKDKVDKLAEGYAKMMKISVEEAKRKLESKLKDECTCSVTPGICRIHKS